MDTKKVESAKSSMLSNKNGISDFLRGVFLSCGVISNPNRGYYLEFDIFYFHLHLNDPYLRQVK